MQGIAKPNAFIKGVSTVPLKVRNYHCDSYGHVNNAPVFNPAGGSTGLLPLSPRVFDPNPYCLPIFQEVVFFQPNNSSLQRQHIGLITFSV